jgi:hypothetical protein
MSLRSLFRPCPELACDGAPASPHLLEPRCVDAIDGTAENSPICRLFRVSEGTRTPDRLDHNPCDNSHLNSDTA